MTVSVWSLLATPVIMYLIVWVIEINEARQLKKWKDSLRDE